MTTNELMSHIEKQIDFFQSGVAELTHYLNCNKVIINENTVEPLFYWLQIALENELRRVEENLQKWEIRYKFVIENQLNNMKLEELISEVENTTLIKVI